MCGICGILNFDMNKKVEQKLIQRMCRSMIHRGPDGEGFYFDQNLGLGHRRLSIIDLEGGNQPMSNEDESIWIVQNGEIYNYVEMTEMLKKKGHHFKTKSDTEVIIHLYEEYGEECLSYLNGMFAFAIWDSKKKHLFAARDRIGIKPFYYYVDKHRFVFASEIKAILELGFVDRNPNYKAIGDYLRYTYSIDDQTFIKNIKKLLPANYIMLKNNDLLVRQYWDIPSFQNDSLDEESCSEKLSQLLNDAVRLHLRSDVKVGAHLSGGLDSSSVVALASQNLSYPLETFSGAFEEGREYDERPYIHYVVKKYGTDHHEVVPKAQECVKAIPHLVWLMDEPAVSSGIIAQYFLNKLIGQQVKVVLGGQGGDELFGGYYRFLPLLLKESFIRGKINFEAVKNILGYLRMEGLGKVMQKIKRRQGMMGFMIPELTELCDQDHDRASFKSMREMQNWEIKKYLPGLLQVEDRTSMGFSVESRVPLLDYRLVEFAASIPFGIKMKNFELKYLLRKVAANYLPSEIVERKGKQGFVSPIKIWFRGELFSFVNDILGSKSFKERGLYETKKIAKRLDQFRQGKIDFAEEIWQLLNIELWHRIFIDRRESLC